MSFKKTSVKLESKWSGIRIPFIRALELSKICGLPLLQKHKTRSAAQYSDAIAIAQYTMFESVNCER